MFRCLCECQDLMFHFMGTKQIQSPNFLCPNGTGLDEWQLGNEYQHSKPIWYCIPVCMASWFQLKSEVKSLITSLTSTAFLWLFFFSPFFSSLPLKSSFMVSSQLENWSMRQKVTWSERTYICRSCAHVWRSRRGSFLERFDGDPLNADVVAIDSLYENFCLFEFFLLRFPL